MSAHKHTKEQLKHFKEFYEKEKTEHRITIEDFEQCIEKAKELHIRGRRRKFVFWGELPKGKVWHENMTDKAEELLVLLKDSVEKNKGQEVKWKQESSYNKSIRKEMEEVQDQHLVMNERIQQLEDQQQRAAK